MVQTSDMNHSVEEAIAEPPTAVKAECTASPTVVAKPRVQDPPSPDPLSSASALAPPAPAPSALVSSASSVIVPAENVQKASAGWLPTIPTMFPNLLEFPQEIQHRIWDHALSARVITIGLKDEPVVTDEDIPLPIVPVANHGYPRVGRAARRRAAQADAEAQRKEIERVEKAKREEKKLKDRLFVTDSCGVYDVIMSDLPRIYKETRNWVREQYQVIALGDTGWSFKFNFDRDSLMITLSEYKSFGDTWKRLQRDMEYLMRLIGDVDRAKIRRVVMNNVRPMTFIHFPSLHEIVVMDKGSLNSQNIAWGPDPSHSYRGKWESVPDADTDERSMGCRQGGSEVLLGGWKCAAFARPQKTHEHMTLYVRTLNVFETGAKGPRERNVVFKVGKMVPTLEMPAMRMEPVLCRVEGT